ncbi:MAG TPA: S8 family serine peptidase, partial [Actinomycetota bacterium]|nr:S8 family serine peptidase [Actinomycetota bacterium]
KGVAGSAPGAKIMPLRVLDGNGTCSPCATSQAIHYAVDHGAKVINLSLAEVGQEVFGPGQSFTDALDYAWNRGVVTVVAAGNSYFLTSGYSNNNAIIVSATNRSDGKPDFSNGVGDAKWGIAAPGGGSTFDSSSGDIYSTYWDGTTPNRYAYNAGTSMSAPHVSGAAAVLRGLGLSAQQTVDRLLSTATDLGPPGRDSTFGAGRLDLAAAVKGLGSTGSGGGGGGGGGTSPTPRRRSGGGSGTGGSTPVASQTPHLDPTGPAPSTSPTVAVPPEDPGPPSKGVSDQGWIAAGTATALFALAGLVQWLRRRSRA